MKSVLFAVLIALLSLSYCLQIIEDTPKALATSVNKRYGRLDNLKWNCDTCATSCDYGEFRGYCADRYYCACTNVSICPGSMGNDC
jgi:hypothetical protein